MPFDLSSAKPVGSGGFDLSSAKPVDAEEATTAEKIAAEPIVRMFTSAAEPIMGAAAMLEKPWGGTYAGDTMKQLKGMQERGAKARGLSDLTGMAADISGSLLSAPQAAAMKAPAAASALGRVGQMAGWGGVSGMTSDPDKPLTSGAVGAGLGAGLGSLAEGAGKIAGRIFGKKPPEPTLPPVGEGAEKAVNELQAQREIVEGTAKPRDLPSQSAYETSVLERDKVTTPLRQQAFRETKKVDTAPVLKMVETMEAENPSPKVRSTLKQVRQVLQNATQESKKAGLPPAGAKISLQDLKALQGQDNALTVKMVDEVRQDIKRLIDQKGDASLDKHTQELLSRLRDRLVEGTPESYRKYLSEYARLSGPIDQFTTAGTARTKVTGDPATFHLWDKQDKQNMMQKAFSGDRPGQALSELVRDTSHNPEAAQGVRQAYTDWLTEVDAKTKLPTASRLTDRWKDTREAVRSSGLMTEEHIANMDKVMDDVRTADKRGGVARMFATTAGWIAGNSVGHPIAASHAARELLTGTSAQNRADALEKALIQIASDPNGAAMLSAPPTQDGIQKVIQKLIQIGVISDTQTGKNDSPPKRKSRNPLGMEVRI